MRWIPVFAILTLLSSSCGGEAPSEEVPLLTEKEAATLVDQAVRCRGRVWNQARALGAKLLRRDAGQPEVCDLTLAAYMFGGEGRLDEGDFRSVVDRRAVAAAMYPMRSDVGSRIPKYPSASIAHPEHVVRTTIDIAGREARGVVHVKAEGAFEGHIHYKTVFEDDAWEVVEVAFPLSEVRLVHEGGRWKLQPSASVVTPNPLRGTELSLPQLSEVGREPTSDRIVISVTREGMFRIQGNPTPRSLRELSDELRMLTSDPSQREADRTSKINVILDVDETVPFTACSWLLQVCAEPTIGIYRVYLGARAASGEAGALAFYLPKDQGPGEGRTGEPIEVRLNIVASRAHFTTPRALLARLARIPASQWAESPLALVFATEKSRAAPYGAVMRILDAARHAGAGSIRIRMPFIAASTSPEADEPEAMAAYFAGLRAMAVMPKLYVGDDLIEEAPADAPELPAGERMDRDLGFGIDPGPGHGSD